MEHKNSITPQEMASLYGVSLDVINNGIQNGDLFEEKGEIRLNHFRAWCEEHQIPSSKEKKCFGCGETLPAYRFARNIYRSDGLESRCIVCKRANAIGASPNNAEEKTLFSESQPDCSKVSLSQFSAMYSLTETEIIRVYIFFTKNEVSSFALSANDILINKKEAERFIISAFDFKRCSRCGKIERYSKFYTNSKLWHGRQAWCKVCITKYGKDRREGMQMTRAKSELDGLLEKYPILKDLIKAQQYETERH